MSSVVALIAISALLAGAALFASAIRTLAREHARERQLLVNQLLHATGQTWQPPPADNGARDEPAEKPVEYVLPSMLNP